MARKTLDSETRWQRPGRLYEQSLAEILAADLPAGIASMIESVQEQFAEIAQKQKQEQVGGGSLLEYEVLLLSALAKLGADFDYMNVRQILEGLFNDALSIDRIASVEAGEKVISSDQAQAIKVAAKLLAQS